MSVRFILIVVSLASALALLAWRGRVRARNAGMRRLARFDWSRINDYSRLSAAAAEAHGLAPDAFLAGPFQRFLEICSDPRENARVRARAMEFGRGALGGYARSLAARGGDAEALHRRARAMAADWFERPGSADGDYMLEVLDGVSNHNFRGRREA